MKTLNDVPVYAKRSDQIERWNQKRAAQLKKQVTHWIGKFMIVKAENNKLRAQNRIRNAVIIDQIKEISSLNSALGKAMWDYARQNGRKL